MKKLSFYKYSMKEWASALPQFSIRDNLPQQKTALDLIAGNPNIKIKDLTWIDKIDERVHRAVETELKYRPYTEKMKKQIEKMKQSEEFTDISWIPFERFEKQFTEEQYEKLIEKRPKTIHAASRIPGIRASTILYLHYLAKKINVEKK